MRLVAADSDRVEKESFRGRLAACRESVPLILPVIGISLGQILSDQIAFKYVCIGSIIVGFGLAIGISTSRKIIPTWTAALTMWTIVGTATSLLNRTLDPPYLKSGLKLFLAEVEAPIRNRRAGEVVVPLEIRDMNDYLNRRSKFTTSQKLMCRAIQLPGRNSLKLRGGELIWVRAEVKELGESGEISSYDASLKRAGYSGSCKLIHISLPLQGSKREQSFGEKIGERMKLLLGDNQTTGLMRSLAIGTRDTLSSDVDAAFSITGLSHLLVVSGYQVGMMFWLGVYIFRRVSRYLFGADRRWIQQCALLLGGVFAWAYIEIVGWEYAGIRAGVAIIVFITAKFTERGRGMSQSILAAFLVMIVFWPGCQSDLSVELTFAALSGLALGNQLSRNMAPIAKALIVTGTASLLTSLVLLIWRGSLSIVGFVLNPIVAPLISFVGTPLTLFALFCDWIGLKTFGSLLLQAIHRFMELFVILIVWISHQPGVSITNAEGWLFWSLLSLEVMAILCIATVVLRQMKIKKVLAGRARLV